MTPRATSVAVTLARKMGLKDRRPKSRRMISRAKTAPPIGVLKEAEMPAPAPAASSTESSRRVKPSVRPTALPKAAPP